MEAGSKIDILYRYHNKLADYSAYFTVNGGETREEALTHIEKVILIILTEMESNGVLPPPDTVLPGSIVLTFAVEEET